MATVESEVPRKRLPSTAWKPGESGNPGGLPKGVPRISTSLQKILRCGPHEIYEPKNKADQIALTMIDSALKGDSMVTKEILDRCEGKVSQSLQVTAAQLPTHEIVERLVDAFAQVGIEENQTREVLLRLAAEND